MRLDNQKIKTAKAKAKPYRLSDGCNLYLEVRPGKKKPHKHFVYRGMLKGQIIEIRLGKLPELKIEEARNLARHYKGMTVRGKDPRPVAIEHKYGTDLVIPFAQGTDAPSLRDCMAESFKIRMESAKDGGRNLAKQQRFIERNGGTLLDQPVNQITPNDIGDVLKPIWHQESGKRMRADLRTAISYAIGKGYTDTNAAGEVIDAILPKGIKTKVQNRKAVHHSEMPEIIRKIRECNANPIHKLAWQFMAHTATRASETLAAQWTEIDLKSRIWTIPAERMKTSKEHSIPLSAEAMDILKQAKDLGDGREHVFPSTNKAAKHLNIISLDRLREKIGIKGKMDNHGTRAVFKTWAHEETDYKPDLVEQCLAHEVGSMVERAYNRAQTIERRREIMEAYSKFLTETAGKGVPARTPQNAT